jgi:predicted acyltransferase
MTTELEAPVRQGYRTARPVEKKPTSTDRCLTLDAYRGFTMLLMVSGGLAMGHLLKADLPESLPNKVILFVADQLGHRDWDMTFAPNAGFAFWDNGFHAGTGCTIWDLIQPSFMFIVGAAMPFAFARRQELGQSWGRQFGHVVRRCLLLIAIGIFLDSYADQKLEVQFIRVLQQIAIGYFLAFLVLDRGPRVQAATAGLLLVGHTLAYFIYGWATNTYAWQRDQNVGWAVDEVLYQVSSLGGRFPTMMPHSRGSYVTINAISSTATILFGVLAGELLRREWPASRKLLLLGLAGVSGIALGLALSPLIPINKKIWTASFTLFAGGCTSLLLLVFYGIIDVLHWRRWTFPLVVVGMNSIAIYVVAGVFGSNIRRAWESFLGVPLHEVPLAAPVILAALTVVGEWLFCYWLYRRRIFFKV